MKLFGLAVARVRAPATAEDLVQEPFWVIIHNSAYGPKAGAYSIPAGNDLGPVGSAATNTSPWGNIFN